MMIRASTPRTRRRIFAIHATCGYCHARVIFAECGFENRSSIRESAPQYCIHSTGRLDSLAILWNTGSRFSRMLAMQSPREILTHLWTSVGGDPAALESVTLTGEEPQLPSSCRLAAAAQASISAAGLAAAQIWQLRSGQTQHVTIDMRHAVVECRSERYLRVDGKPPPPAWGAIAGIYTTRDQRFVRLHTNFPHHRAAVCKVLN